MIPYLGDFVEDDIVYMMFNTFSSDDPSASCTITNFINTDVHIHKDDGLTQRCNAAGITVSVNFDGITGSHLIKIDTSDNTVAGFWVTGHDYFVRIEGTTVDAATINAVVGHFSIQNRFMRGTDSAATAAALTTHDGKLDTCDTVCDGIQTDLSNATDGLGALKTLIDAIPTTAMRGTDGANTTVPDAAGVAPTSAEIKTEIEQAGSSLAQILTDTNELELDWKNDGRLDLILDAIPTTAMRGTDGANTTVPDAAGVAPTSAEIKTEIEQAGSSLAQILTDTNELELDWKNDGRLDLILDAIPTTAMRGTDGANTTVPDAAGVAPTSAEIKTEIEQAGSSLAQILTDTNELELDWKNDGRLDLILDAIPTTAMRGTDGANTTVPDIAGTLATYDPPTRTEATADKDAIIADLLTMKKTAAGAYDRDTDSLEAIRNQGDAAWTTGGGGVAPTVGQIRAEMEGAGYFLDLIKADTNELQTDWANGGRLDLLLDACNTTTPPTVLAIADQVWDEILTGDTHNISTSAGRRVREVGAFAIHSGTAQAGNTHSITVAASASPSDAAYHGIFNRNLIVITDNTGVGQTRTIVDYDAITKVVIVDRDWRISPDATTEYQIVPDDTPLTVDHGVARGGTNRTITIRTYAASDDDAYLCNIVTIIAGAGRGQARLVDSYDGTNKIVTICGDDWVVTPDTTSVYVMMPYGVACAACMGSEALDEIADCVWDEDLTIHTTSNSAGWFIQKIKSIANFIRIKLL